jgi:hypothetical protein
LLLCGDFRERPTDTFLPFCLASAYAGRKKVRAMCEPDGWEPSSLAADRRRPSARYAYRRTARRTLSNSGDV